MFALKPVTLSPMKTKVFVIVACFALCLSACAGGGRNIQPTNPGAGNGPAMLLRSNRKSGDRVRTRKLLIVSEVLSGGMKVKSTNEQTFINEVLRADAHGNPIQIRRHYEMYVTRAKQAGKDGNEIRGALEGCELELFQLADGLSVRLISGEAKPEDYRNKPITSFDAAILPVNEVRRGSRWQIDVAENPVLTQFLSDAGIIAERNELSAEFYDLRDGDAHISINWRVTGKTEQKKPIVFQLTGEIVVDTKEDIIREVSLSGGKTDGEGRVLPQIAMSIRRERVTSWYK